MCCTFPSCLVLLICDMQDCCHRPNFEKSCTVTERDKAGPSVAARGETFNSSQRYAGKLTNVWFAREER